MPVFPGRYAGAIDGDFVVFAIGMRINRLWKPHRWLPVARAMPKMLRELAVDPETGFLGASQGFLHGGPAVLQYWRSFEHLERYARDAGAAHLPAWREFNQRVRASADVGIWHETYRVRAGEYETIYRNMPLTGLARAGSHELLGSSSTAATRIRAHAQPGG
jgi:Domain of unknown function (DUF4188)